MANPKYGGEAVKIKTPVFDAEDAVVLRETVHVPEGTYLLMTRYYDATVNYEGLAEVCVDERGFLSDKGIPLEKVSIHELPSCKNDGWMTLQVSPEALGE